MQHLKEHERRANRGARKPQTAERTPKLNNPKFQTLSNFAGYYVATNLGEKGARRTETDASVGCCCWVHGKVGEPDWEVWARSGKGCKPPKLV